MYNPTADKYCLPATISLLVIIIDFIAIEVVHADESCNDQLAAVTQVDAVISEGLTIDKPVQKSSSQDVSQIEDDIQCLALNIYFEARSESQQGQLAVGHVVMNRVASNRFPNTPCAVIRQGGEQRLNRCQFSWWCDGRSDKPINQKAWKQSLKLAKMILTKQSVDPTEGALWYHADYVDPYWSKHFTVDKKIGQHVFYVIKTQQKYALK